MYPRKDNVVNSKAHTTTLTAVKALKSEGTFTVLSPVNDEFENLPEGTVATFLKS